MQETTSIIMIYDGEVVASLFPPQTLAIVPLTRELRKDTIIRTRVSTQLNRIFVPSRILLDYELSIIRAISGEVINN
ncbi:unnamed protein product [Rotaria sp. Silwood1]|nr:unnamed protein product [Rotaria sp. Silwood1]